MEIFKFNKKEIKEMEMTLKKVIKDIHELYKSSSFSELKVYFDLFNRGEEDWVLKYHSNKYITIEDAGDYAVVQESYILAEPFIGSSPKTLIDLNSSKSADRVYRFLSKYDEIREKIIEEIRKGNKEKKSYSTNFENVVNKYVRDATIEIDFHQTQNVPTIEVKKDNGNTLGEIKMGSGIIRIITKGNILLEKPSVESKKIKKI